MHKHTFLLIVLTILFGCTKTQAQTSQAEQLFDKFKAASRFDYRTHVRRFTFTSTTLPTSKATPFGTKPMLCELHRSAPPT